MVAQLSEYRILVPQRFNDGQPVSPALRERIEEMLFDLFEGFTAQRGLDGAWRASDGRVFPDCNDEYRFLARDEASAFAVALEVGLLLGQYAVYLGVPAGQGMIVPTDHKPSHPAAYTQVSRYGLPKEAVANLLRLPSTRGGNGELLLRYVYFQEEVRSVQIILNDYPMPQPMTHTPGGMAIVGLAGTCVEVRATDELEYRRVREFLDAKLHGYEL